MLVGPGICRKARPLMPEMVTGRHASAVTRGSAVLPTGHDRLSSGLIGHEDHARREWPGADQLQFEPIAKEWFAPSQSNRMNQQLIFVDQAQLCELLDNAGTSVDQHVLAILLFERVDFLGINLPHDLRVVPFGSVQSSGKDEFAHRIQLARISLLSFGGIRLIGDVWPRTGKALVRHSAEHERIGLVDDIVLVLAHFVVETFADEAHVVVRPRCEPSKADPLRENQFSHHVLLYYCVERGPTNSTGLAPGLAVGRA